jgi:branched-chain amino acid transport system permease protein
MGWALRATAQDRDAAAQMGVDVNAVNRTAFAAASILGGIAGMLVGMYFNTVYPTMSFQAGLKGFAANLLGGLGNIPGALIGGLLLGLIESYGVAAFGATYRNLFAFVIILIVLVIRPERHLQPPPPAASRAADRHLLMNKRPLAVPAWAIVLAAGGLAAALPLLVRDPYLLQILTNAWLFGMLALSVTLVTGTAGQMSLGQAGFLAIGAYASALLSLRLGWPVELAMLAAALITPCWARCWCCRLSPARPLCGHRHPGHWRNRCPGDPQLGNTDQRRDGHHQYPAPACWDGKPLRRKYLLVCAGLLLLAALLQWRLLRSPLGRTWRAIREDDVAAQAYGISLNRYKALAFAASAFIAGLSGAFTAHLYTYINHETFPTPPRSWR